MAFLLAKLVSAAGAVLSSGTASAFLIPYFQNKDQGILSDLLNKKDSLRDKFDFQKLDQEAKANIELLNQKISKFTLAKTITNIWKHVAYHNIEKIFESLSQAETKLTNLYKEIVSQIEKLSQKYEEISKSQQEKLEAEKEKQFQSILKDSYSKLSVSLKAWESFMKEIKCEIAKNCNKTIIDGITGFINSIFPVLPETSPSNSGGDASGSSSNGQTLSGSEKAQAELTEIGKELSRLISETEQKNNDYKVKYALASLKEKLIFSKFLFLENWIKFLYSQKTNLESDIQAKGKETEKLIKNIEKSRKQLVSNHQNYTKLRQQEVDLNNWKSKLQDVLLKNKSDLEREDNWRL